MPKGCLFSKRVLLSKSLAGQILAVLLALPLGGAAAAATPQASLGSAILPSTVEPARTGQAISQEPFLEEEPMLSPELRFQIMHGQKLSKEMAALKVHLKAIHIENPVVYTCEELLEPFQCFIGKTVTLGEIQDIATQITTRYQKEGYILTQVIIPPQHVHDGIVTLKVIAGYVDKLHISGDIPCDLQELIQSYGCKIQNSRPLQLRDLERYTLLINDIPGVKVNAILTPSKTTPQSADINFVVEQHHFSGYAAVNNYGTRYLGPVQYFLGGEIDSMIMVGDLTQVQAVTTANKQLNFIDVRYSEIMGCEGFRGAVFGQYLHEVPNFTLSPFDIKGNYTVGGVDFLYPIIRGRQTNLNLTGGFMVLDSETTTFGMDIYDDHIRPLYVGLDYNYQDSLKGVNHASLILTQGLRVLGASGKTNISRPRGESVFTKLNPLVSRYQLLPCDFSFVALVEGQYSFDTLLSAEQFGVGGPQVGRGYDPSEIIGDHGISGTLELRYDKFIIPEKLSSQYYVFYDAGVVWNRDPTFLYKRASVTSTGIGIRLTYLDHIEGTLFFAKPLTRKVATFNNKDIRVFFSLLIKG